MPTARPFALVRTRDQWLRARHENTFLDADGVVTLAWTDPQRLDVAAPAPALGAGLAFDGQCRLYHSIPSEGQVQRLLWAASGPAASEGPVPVDLFAEDAGAPGGSGGAGQSGAGADAFVPLDPSVKPLAQPRGLAVDADDRLFVAESGAGRILVLDLWSLRLLRRVTLSISGGGVAPLDLACRGYSVWAVAGDPAGLLRLEARRGPVEVPLPAAGQALAGALPRRVAVSPSGELHLLYRGVGDEAWVVAASGQSPPLAVPGASDVEFLSDGTLVVARQPEADFVRVLDGLEQTPLKARGYDGMGIVRTPDGRIGFWTAAGFRHAVPAGVDYAPRGRVCSYRLDGGEFHTRWGRLFVDACVPEGTDLRVHVVTTDETSDEPAVARTPPGNVLSLKVGRPDLSPPMPPESLAPKPGAVVRPLHRRETGRELPWARMAAGDPFETYEAPIDAPPGRYLWVTLELRGTSRLGPKVRALRAEHRSHDLLTRLPQAFSRDEAVAAFLLRYLAPFEGALAQLDSLAGDRQVLLDPWATPEEALPWLASFVGLVLDERWPVAARRRLIDEIVCLFRFRGTVGGLRRFLEIYLGVQVVIVELFRLRGLGGAVLGEPASGPVSTSVVGAGLRVGGAVGESELSVLGGTVEDAFATHAHRFFVIVPALLTSEQADVVDHVLEVHRPAHTVVEVCTVGAGMRVGVGLLLGLSSLIGPTGGFVEVQLGDAVLGRGSVVGLAAPGTAVGRGVLGADTRVG